MTELTLPPGLATQLAGLYRQIEERYDEVAGKLDFSCQGCPDNCCDSYFLHYTYSEWSYLWQGLRQLPEEKQQALVERGRQAVTACEESLGRGERPRVLCPLNDNGLCALYAHRLLICRLHGVPAVFRRPDGKDIEFPGCFRCQEQTARLDNTPEAMDRTDFFQRMVAIERQLLEPLARPMPRLKTTIARMLADGPPRLP